MVLFNVAILLHPAFAAKISSAKNAPHQRFQNSLSDSIKYNRSPFKYNNPEGLILHGHKEKPRISKILKFQMEKILSDYEITAFESGKYEPVSSRAVQE